MRKQLLIIFSLITLLPLIAQDNLLKNGGFESNPPLSCWGQRTIIESGGKEPEAVIDRTVKKSGQQSLKIRTFGQNDLTILVASPISVVTGKTYRISCWIKNDGCRFELRQDLIGKHGRHIPKRYKRNICICETFDWKYFETKVAVKAGEEKLGFTMFIGKTPGTIWLDDFSIEEILPTNGEEVIFRMTPNYYTDDNVYHLPQHNPMIVYLTASNELQHSSAKPRIVIDLPEGIELVGCDFDTEEYATPEKIEINNKQYTRYEYKMGVPDILLRNIDFSRSAFGSAPIMIKATASPSEDILTAYIHFKDDKISCRKCPFKIKITPPVPTAKTPRLFRTGISTATSLEFFGKPLQEWIPFYKNCGFNEIIINGFLRAGSRNNAKHNRNPAPIVKELKCSGLSVYCNSNRLVNGYMVRYIPMSKDIPDSVFIKRADGTISKNAFDPAYIYRNGEWYVKAVNYVLDQALKRGYDHLWCNWEPHMYRLQNGSFTKRSLEDFAKFSGIPLEELNSIDPRKIPEKYQDKLMAFQSWQFAKAMEVLNRLVEEKSKEKGKKINLLLCVGPNFLEEFKKGNKYWDYTGCYRAKDFLKHLDRISSWHYLYFQAKDMLDKKQARLIELGLRKGELGTLTNRTHRETIDEVEPKVAFIRKTCQRDGKAPIPYIHLTQNSQCNDWVVKPKSIGLQMLATFIASAQGVQLYYFPMGYDGRYWKSAAEANNKIAYFEDYVINGNKVDKGVELKPLTKLFQDENYKQNLVWRAFEKDGKTVLALCNFDFLDDAVFELKCSNPKLNNHVFQDPLKKEYFIYNTQPVVLKLPPMTIQFFITSPLLQNNDYGKNISLQDVTETVRELDLKYESRINEINKLISMKSRIKTVDYSNITPFDKNGCSAMFDSETYVVKTPRQQLTVLPKSGAIIKSWQLNGKEMVLQHDKIGYLGKDRFYVPKNNMDHPELSGPYKFISHHVTNDSIEVVFQNRIENGELTDFIIEKTISLSLKNKGIKLKYKISNHQSTPRLFGFWVFNCLNATREIDGKKPKIKFGDSLNEIIGKVCIFQNTDIPLLKGYESRLKKLCHPDLWQKKATCSLSVNDLKITAQNISTFMTWKIASPPTTTLEIIYPPQLLKQEDSWQSEIDYSVLQPDL